MFMSSIMTSAGRGVPPPSPLTLPSTPSEPPFRSCLMRGSPDLGPAPLASFRPFLLGNGLLLINSPCNSRGHQPKVRYTRRRRCRRVMCCTEMTTLLIGGSQHGQNVEGAAVARHPQERKWYCSERAYVTGAQRDCESVCCASHSG